MVSSKCFVPGCRTGYERESKIRKEEGKRMLSLFSPPVEKDKLQKWKIAIRRADRELSAKDKVCELHFLPNEICRNYTHLMPDGITVVIPKGKISLVEDAVPSIFPFRTSNSTEKSKKRKPPVKKILSSKSDKNRKTYLKKIPLSENTDSQDIQIEEVFTNVEAVLPFTFDDLLESISEVRKPNKFWSVSSHEDFILCVKWDSEFSPERQIIVDSNLGLKFMYCGIEASPTSHTPIESVESLSQIIAKVDKCEICPGAGAIDENENCSVYMEREWGIGRPNKWCIGCRIDHSSSYKDKSKKTLIVSPDILQQ